MTVIDADAACVTLINTFTVQPENQQELIEVLNEATDHVMRLRAGFISASIHRSLDGRHVVNYAQWRSRQDFESMQADPTCREHMARAAGLAEKFEPMLCSVESVHESRPPRSPRYSADIFVSL